jgi:hypothetical protein
MCDIVARLMAKKPQDRFASASDVASTLEDCLAHVQNPAAVPLPSGLASPGIKTQSTRSRPPGYWSRRLLAAAGGFLFFLATIAIVLELNKGTLKIESIDGTVPIRIMKGNMIVDRLTVTPDNDSIRIAAGEYVIEIEGKHDGIQIENQTVTITRGNEHIVKIIHSPAEVARNPNQKNPETNPYNTETNPYNTETNPYNTESAGNPTKQNPATRPFPREPARNPSRKNPESNPYDTDPNSTKQKKYKDLSREPIFRNLHIKPADTKNLIRNWKL